MAGGTQHRSGRTIVKSPSSISDDGTVADASLCDTSASGSEHELHREQVQQVRTHPGGAGPDEIAPLGANIIEALGIVNKLEQLNLDRQEISLPKCIVLGKRIRSNDRSQQSTGKSSVIEAISGIKLPRDTGTCTRCPMYIELQPTSDPRGVWHAEVYLLRQYNLDLNPGRRENDVEFQGWIPAPVPDRVPFATTEDPGRLEHLIRCAQRATLSPLEDSVSFLDSSFDDSDIHKTLFSPNIVGIAVSRPKLPPLSFFDLPGMIGQAETDDEAFTVPLIENLVTKYIMDPEALVLVTCALESDVANSIAAGLAKRKGVTNRCMGVLTKPDRLPAGESPKDLGNILDGRRFQMGHGYFVVKNLNSEEIRQGLTHQDARRLEADFFSTKAPWATDLKFYSVRFGTLNLQHYLSSVLGNRVLAKLPDIQRQIEQRLASVDDELSRIPEIPPYTAVRTVADVLESFSRQVSSEMAGDHGHVIWKNTWKGLQKAFWDNLLVLKPTMRVAGDRDKTAFQETLAGGSADDSILIGSDSEDDVPETPSKKRKPNPPPAVPKCETQTPAPGSSPFRTPQKPSARLHQPGTPTSISSSSLARFKRQLKLDDIALQINQSAGSDVKGQIDRKARDEMMLSTLEHWPVAIDVFFTSLEQQLKARMHAIFDLHFRHWKGSELRSASLDIFNDVLDDHLNEQRVTMASESFKDERTRLHLFHYDVFDMEKTSWMEKCASKRLEARINMYVQEAADRNGGVFSAADEAKLKKDERRMVILKREPYRVEIDLVADMIAHYTIAARRIHDKITMRIESKFFEQLREKLRDELQARLGIYDGPNGPSKAQCLLAESPARQQRRNAYVAERKALTEGLRYIEEHYQRIQSRMAPGSGPVRHSNYQRPSTLTPPAEDMEDVQSSRIPLRSRGPETVP